MTFILISLYRTQDLHVENPLTNASEVKVGTQSNYDQKSSASESGESQDATNPLLDRSDCPSLTETQNLDLTSNGSQLVLQSRPETTLSTGTFETTDTCSLEHVHGPVLTPCLSRQSGGVDEASVGSSVSCTDVSDPRMQAASIGSFTHKRLQEVGQTNTAAVQCTSPRNSCYGHSTCVGNSLISPRTHTLLTSQCSSVNAGVNLGPHESSDMSAADDGLPHNFSPVEATPNNDDRSYMTTPQYYLTPGISHLPNDIQRTHQQREPGRVSEYPTLANGEPNNNSSLIERQRSDGNEDNGS